jgi:hypothetical protein
MHASYAGSSLARDGMAEAIDKYKSPERRALDYLERTAIDPLRSLRQTFAAMHVLQRLPSITAEP